MRPKRFEVKREIKSKKDQIETLLESLEDMTGASKIEVTYHGHTENSERKGKAEIKISI